MRGADDLARILASLCADLDSLLARLLLQALEVLAAGQEHALCLLARLGELSVAAPAAVCQQLCALGVGRLEDRLCLSVRVGELALNLGVAGGSLLCLLRPRRGERLLGLLARVRAHPL